MKYHARKVNSNETVCGRNIISAMRPDWFIYDINSFKRCFNQEFACKNCLRIIKKRKL